MKTNLASEAPMVQGEAISVSFGVSEDYVRHAAVVAASVLAHSGRDFVFHLLMRACSEETRARLAGMEHAWGNRCRFAVHLVDPTRFEGFPLPLEHVSQEAYYRYLLPEILEGETRTLYLDVDLIVREDLAALWELDLGTALAAGVCDNSRVGMDVLDYRRRIGLAEDALYVNSGVLVLDLAGLRVFGFADKCLRETTRLANAVSWPDQDVINLVLANRIMGLPMRWNCQDRNALPHGVRPAIRHFSNATAKPWCNIWKNRSWPVYLRYLLRTPYRTEAVGFVWRHLVGVFWFSYVKKRVRRTLLCGIPIARRVVCYRPPGEMSAAGRRPPDISPEVRIRLCQGAFFFLLALGGWLWIRFGEWLGPAVMLADVAVGVSLFWARFPFLLPRKSAKRPVVLMLHAVGEKVADPRAPNNTVRPGELARLIADLLDAGYAIQPLCEAMDPRSRKRRSLVLTFDDGWADNYSDLFPILRHYDIAATFFLTDRRGGHFLTDAQIKEMLTAGVMEVGGHTSHHVRLAQACDETTAQWEIEENKRTLERLTGRPIVSFAYPFGDFSEREEALVHDAGYRFAVTMHKKTRRLEPLRIPRQIIPRGVGRMGAYLLATRGKHRL